MVDSSITRIQLHNGYYDRLDKRLLDKNIFIFMIPIPCALIRLLGLVFQSNFIWIEWKRSWSGDPMFCYLWIGSTCSKHDDSTEQNMESDQNIAQK